MSACAFAFCNGYGLPLFGVSIRYRRCGWLLGRSAPDAVGYHSPRVPCRTVSASRSCPLFGYILSPASDSYTQAGLLESNGLTAGSRNAVFLQFAATLPVGYGGAGRLVAHASSAVL